MQKNDIKTIVSRTIPRMPHGEAIERIRLFGSYLHGNPTDASDIDLLIDFDQGRPVSFFTFYDITKALADALNKKVDIATPDGLSRFIRDTVLHEAETVYER